MNTEFEKHLTKEKFEVFMLLCAAGIDGIIKMSELEKIMEKYGLETYNEVFEVFKKMTNPDWLSFFKNHVAEFLPHAEDKRAFLQDLLAVISADEHCAVKECNFYKVVEMLCNDEL